LKGALAPLAFSEGAHRSPASQSAGRNNSTSEATIISLRRPNFVLLSWPLEIAICSEVRPKPVQRHASLTVMVSRPCNLSNGSLAAKELACDGPVLFS
jgi:hypothetical protein